MSRKSRMVVGGEFDRMLQISQLSAVSELSSISGEPFTTGPSTIRGTITSPTKGQCLSRVAVPLAYTTPAILISGLVSRRSPLVTFPAPSRSSTSVTNHGALCNHANLFWPAVSQTCWSLGSPQQRANSARSLRLSCTALSDFALAVRIQ